MIAKSGSTADEWKSTRRTVLNVDGGYSANALMKVSGQFAPKADGALFFLANSVEIVDAFAH